MTRKALFAEARQAFHATLLDSILRIDERGIPSNADSSQRNSIAIAQGIVRRIGEHTEGIRLAGQTSGNKFESAVAGFVQTTFLQLAHLRPGSWTVEQTVGRRKLAIAKYEQYAHLIELDRLAAENPELAAALGSDYTISPDVIVTRVPEADDAINRDRRLVDDSVARRSSLRALNNPMPILHASISCKWTLRSDRAQNARSEGLNLVRNRKGKLPHIVVVTGEPTPSRIASIALGTGDIDCVYHFALPELHDTLQDLAMTDAVEMLDVMVQGKRLRDVSDLPLDLAL
jgi:hypothetical protein